jgi:hypothetical protein
LVVEPKASEPTPKKITGKFQENLGVFPIIFLYLLSGLYPNCHSSHAHHSPVSIGHAIFTALLIFEIFALFP